MKIEAKITIEEPIEADKKIVNIFLFQKDEENRHWAALPFPDLIFAYQEDETIAKPTFRLPLSDAKELLKALSFAAEEAGLLILHRAIEDQFCRLLKAFESHLKDMRALIFTGREPELVLTDKEKYTKYIALANKYTTLANSIRVKPERMDSIVKGAAIGKPREGNHHVK